MRPKSLPSLPHWLRATLLILLSGWILGAGSAAAQTPGKDGDRTITGTQIVNEYAPVSGTAAAGATQIDVIGRAGNLPSLSPGDVILIYQAQGASIRGGDNVNYGRIRELGSAGRYEFQTVLSVSGNTIFLQTYGGLCSGLSFTYSGSGKAQVIRVPQYRDLTVNGGSRVVAAPWNGTTGGMPSSRKVASEAAPSE